MKKIALFLIAGLFSSSALAANITISQAPQSPVVITADMQGPVAVPGPWFGVQYKISTDQLITVVGIHEIVTSADGTSTAYYFNLSQPTEIPAGSSFQSEMQYLGGLPKQTGYEYSVSVRLVGWEGASTDKGAMLNSGITFITQ